MEFVPCEVCPNINITHESGVVSSVKACLVDAWLKHTKQNYEMCGREIELKIEQPKEVVDANQFAGIVDADIVESELVE